MTPMRLALARLASPAPGSVARGTPPRSAGPRERTCAAAFCRGLRKLSIEVAVPVLCVTLSACKSPGESAPHDPDEHGHEEATREHQHKGAEGTLIHVEPSMLRDLRVTTEAAKSRPAGDKATLLGELRVNEDAYAEVGSPVPARVARVLKSPGDVVKEGDALVELDSANVGEARASLTRAKARLALAEQSAERKRSLSTDGIVPAKEAQAAEAELAMARAEERAAAQAVSALGAARGAGARFTLATPVGGTVIDRAALRGRLVNAETPLFVVGDLSRLWLVVHAFERDALRVRPGAKASVVFPALPGQGFEGTVAKVGSRVDPASRTVDLRIDVDNPSGVLRPGMSASALVPLGDATETVVTVPVVALQRLGDGWCVFLPHPKEEGVFEVRAVGRGRDLGGEVELLSGLQVGERVVVDGSFLLKAEAVKARGAAHHH